MASEQTMQAGGVGLPEGAKIGKYEVVERLGMGGQAIVYKCRDPLLDRYVAMKQISSHLAGDAKFLERFRREAQILAKLGNEQQAIVTIHELIEDEQGLFIVMEFLDGHSLETVLNDTNGPVEVKATLQILWRLAAALHAVHNEGIIHRDLKPANIIVGQGLRAKITDFGVAASISGQTSMILGTTKYMAPELFEGETVDGRADLYSLGFITYEMLAGRPKFNEIFHDVVRDKHTEALRWMKWHGNVSVNAPALHEVNPAVPEPLSDIVAKMMAKDLGKRFASMEELGRAIKLAFSPRAKPGGKAPKAGAPRPRAAAKAAVATAAAEPTLTPDDSGLGLAATEGGMDPALAPEGAITAPLPEVRLGRKMLVYFVLPLLILMVLGGAVGGVWHLMQQRNIHVLRERQAKNAYSAAVTAMKEGLGSEDWTKVKTALAGFKDVQKRFGGMEVALKGGVLQPLCESYLAVVDGKWEQASNQRNLADQRASDLQKTHDHLKKWTRQAKDYVRNCEAYYDTTRRGREAIGLAIDALEREQFQEARDILKRELQGTVIPDGTALQVELEQLKNRINYRELKTKLTAEMQEADSLLARNKFLEAEQAYQKAQQTLQSEASKSMPAEERSKIARVIATKLKQLTSSHTLNQALAAVDDARTKGDKKLLVAALRNLLRMTKEPAKQKAIQDEITTLESDIELERGRQLKMAGKIAEARAAFEKSNQIKPNKDAQDELAALDKAKQRADLVKAGDTHFMSGKWAEALTEYNQAGKLGMTDDLAAKIVQCNFRLKLGIADQLQAAGEWDKAMAAYEEARKAMPSAAALIDARLEAMAARREYQRLKTEGDAAAKRRQWVAARRFYEQAKKIRSIPEIDAAITETRYQENLDRGREALDQADYKGALGYFNLAKGFKNTEEVRGLIAEAQKKEKDAASGT